MTIAARIRELHAEGYGNIEIAHLIERTPQYVGAVLHKQRRREYRQKMGLTGKPGRPRKVPSPSELAGGPEARQS